MKKVQKFKFLQDLSECRQIALLNELRIIWTHNSTALEGNSLSLGDTHFFLNEGLTIGGKSLKDHEEVMGHQKAIDILFDSININNEFSEELLFNLHKSVQTEEVLDIYKPYGAWKNTPNGTYGRDSVNKRVFFQYASPEDVPFLIKEFINFVNKIDINEITPQNAHIYYARLHIGFSSIHPFWDGNGRITRLISNIPLLKAGLPPIVVPNEMRREYLSVLGGYSIKVGTLNKISGVWPDLDSLKDFEKFCLECYQTTLDLVKDITV